jgi:hypothetical protein
MRGDRGIKPRAKKNKTSAPRELKISAARSLAASRKPFPGALPGSRGNVWQAPDLPSVFAQHSSAALTFYLSARAAFFTHFYLFAYFLSPHCPFFRPRLPSLLS